MKMVTALKPIGDNGSPVMISILNIQVIKMDYECKWNNY